MMNERVGEEKMKNTALRRAALALAHPLTVGAIAVLLLNDQVLRWRWPSWITGKLGDVAWLFFAPLAVALVIALILPRRMPSRSHWVMALAVGLVGVPFALGNVWSPAMDAMRAVYRTALGSEPLMVSDPTDLLTLPVLFLSWRWWHSIDVTGEGVPRRAWGLLILASLATLGNAAAPDYGILCLREKNGEIVAAGGPWQFQGPFVSRDGGLTWREEPEMREDVECLEQPKPQTLEIPESSEIYRFEPGVRVELSRDGGQTWATEVNLGGHDARAAYRRVLQGGGDDMGPGPLDALFDPRTDNVILAMGREGILVSTSPGQWEWVAVGRYEYIPLETVGQVAVLLQGEIWLAAALALVAFAGWNSRVDRRWAAGLVVALGVIWLAVAVAARPAIASGYLAGFAILPALVVTLLSLPLALWRGWRGYRQAPAMLLRAAAFGLGAGVLYLAPFVLWGFGIVSRYHQALLGAVALVAVPLLPGAYSILRTRRADQEAT